MKPLLVVAALAGALLGIASSCGPQQPFCPENPPMYNCLPDAGGGFGGQGGMMNTGPCDGGSYSTSSDGAITCI